MKNVAVLVHSLTIEYAVEVMNGISSYFKDKDDVRLIIGQVKNPHCVIGLYEYQCWSASSFLFSKEIDGVIIISGSFSSTMDANELSEEIKKLVPKVPVVSIGLELNLKNSYYTTVECKSVYKEMIKHLKVQHDCKKIAFLGANLTQSPEALERFEAYKEGLAANGFEYDPGLLYEAFFTLNTAYETMKSAFTSKDQIPFDAILAANDLMALGCMKALQELGVKIPKEVKIIGFDNTTHASHSVPKLTTLDQGIFNQGYEGADFLYSILNGKKDEKSRTLKTFPVYRQSCGCIPAENVQDVYLNQEGRICVPEESKNTPVNGQYYNFLSEIDSIYALFDMVKASNSTENFFYSLSYLLGTSSISSMAVCLYDKPLNLTREDNFVLPDSINLSIFVDIENEINVFNPGIKFNPHRKILPEKYFKDIPGNYILQPIFSGESNYGYLICTLKNDNFSVYCICLKILINAIAQSYELSNSRTKNIELSKQNQQLQLDNSDLSLKSKTDELTRILNRRGFLELGQKTLDIALDMESTGLVLFADMDGLKKINDTYGHKMGDKAIKAMSTVLTKSLRANDVVGRLSGDEFAAVAVGMNSSQIEKIRTKIDSLCEEISKEKDFPFNLSCSFGAVEFTTKNKKLKTLLLAADKKLYIEKRKKHDLRENINN